MLSFPTEGDLSYDLNGPPSLCCIIVLILSVSQLPLLWFLSIFLACTVISIDFVDICRLLIVMLLNFHYFYYYICVDVCMCESETV